jgi:membrane-bound lytic murein transglycosylase B
MQFMPATWKRYGVDANEDGVKDPFNPVDAIFAAARYLEAAGGEHDIRRAIFAYNHATWYVDSVLMRAQVVGGLRPSTAPAARLTSPPRTASRSRAIRDRARSPTSRSGGC